MLYRLYKGNSPYTIMFIILTGALLWLPGFISSTEQTLPFDYLNMPFFKWLTNLINSALIERISGLTLLILAGLYLNKIASEFGFLRERSQLPALFFILINSAFPTLQRLTPPILIGLLFLWAMERIMLSYRKENLSFHFFEASFLIATASFFYLQILFFWPLVFVALIIMRPVIWREWITSLIGLVLPYALLIGFWFLFRDNISGLLISMIDQFSIIHSDMSFNLFVQLFLVMTGIMTISGSVLMIQTLPVRKIFARKAFLFFFWTFIFSLFAYVIISNSGIELILFASFPLAFLFSEYFLQMRSKLRREVAFIVFVLIVSLSSYSGLFPFG
jgi:hypothetical protein